MEILVAEKIGKSDISGQFAKKSRLENFINKLWWRVHCVFPNTLSSPFGSRDREYEKRRDAEVNAESRVPEEEELRIPVVWGAELFGPAEVEALYEHLGRLKWSSVGGMSSAGNALDWIRHQRSYGNGGGWYNVDAVVRPQDRDRWLMHPSLAQLPNEVDYLKARFIQITPSLTCALIGFVLKEEVARSYERELNKDRQSVRKRSRHGWSIENLDPGHLKSDAINSVRTEMRMLVGNWFKTNLPGYFSGRSVDRLPTAELLTTKTTRPLSEEVGNGASMWSGWHRIIANPSRFDVWTSASCIGLQLWMADSHRVDDEAFHMVVALCAADVSDESVKYYGGHDRHAYVSYSHEHLDGVLSNYAALAYLKEVSKDVRSSRTALKISKLGSRKCVQVLDQIQRFFDRSLGTPAVAGELCSRSENLGSYRHECSKFLAPAWSKEAAPQEIAEALKNWTNWLATRVVAEEYSAREHFEQLANILSVRESVRTQRRMELLTIAALIVATCSLGIAIPAIKSWLDRLGPIT